MPRLLHVSASPRKGRSASLEVADAFVAAWRAKHSGAEVDALDVWTTPLPEFDGAALEAKYAGLAGQALSAEQARVWDDIRALAARFTAADVILFSLPMWNYGVPYRLKHLIDAVSQKDLVFTFDERGQLGMLGGRRGVVVAARGVALEGPFPRDEFDHQTSYMKLWFKMVGIEDVATIEVEKTLYGPEPDRDSRARGREAAAALAAGY